MNKGISTKKNYSYFFWIPVICIIISFFIQKIFIIIINQIIRHSGILSFDIKNLYDKILGTFFFLSILIPILIYINFNIKEFIISFQTEEKRNLKIYLKSIILSVLLSFTLILLTLLILQLSYDIFKLNPIDSSKTLNIKYLSNLIFSKRNVFKAGINDHIYIEYYKLKNGYLFLILNFIYILFTIFIEEFLFRYFFINYDTKETIFSNSALFMTFILAFSSRELFLFAYAIFGYFMLTSIYFYTKDLLLAIINHFIFEIEIYILPYFYLKIDNTYKIELSYKIVLFFVLIILTIILILKFKKYFKKNKEIFLQKEEFKN